MAYLTVQEYIRRYGVQETAQITNEVRASPGQAPEVDEAKVEEAIADATDIVNGYVGRRYALPLSTVPRIVKSWVGDLARERLFRTRPIAAATDAADRVRDQLKDLSLQRLDLPVPEGATAPIDTSAGTVLTSGDGEPSTFGRGALGRYMGTFGGGYCETAAWKRGNR